MENAGNFILDTFMACVKRSVRFSPIKWMDDLLKTQVYSEPRLLSIETARQLWWKPVSNSGRPLTSMMMILFSE